jgi:hypothetical protein
MYRYEGPKTLAQQLADTERRLAAALAELEALKHPKLPTPHSDGHARLLAATREAFPKRTKDGLACPMRTDVGSAKSAAAHTS